MGIENGQLRMWIDGGHPNDVPFLVIGRYHDDTRVSSTENWEIIHCGNNYIWDSTTIEQFSRVLDEAW